MCKKSFSLQCYLFSSTISLATISVFLKLGFLLKLAIMLVSAIGHVIIYSTHTSFRVYYENQDME